MEVTKRELISLIVIFVVLTILLTSLSIISLKLKECKEKNKANERRCGDGTSPDLTNTTCVAELTCGPFTMKDPVKRECIVDSAYNNAPPPPSSGDSSTGTCLLYTSPSPRDS